jgi:tripeptidyl-peptidase-1
MSEDATSIYGAAFATGGGFSNVYPVPSYQAAALKTYFGRHNPPYLSYSAFGTAFDPGNVSANGGLYNRIGRGIPDVAANGDNIVVVSRGQTGLVIGTSASTPIFGAIINRVSNPEMEEEKTRC